ncbi:hypothetical protein [Pseudoalteromonas luteoviolacea]|uniref:Uncharacterized protein n=1 Tax=Pseudoalteromonas luteoviolacea NCIMB 1942 TaxID=1365253 RepID=A0A167APX3_9GAMM|nr:hypothetical protein [Pseudoalteromonas luteoviolacea]KZN45660.1 hypothetical protein N482_14010 [Pseudoalteromonas luteoviolacea NCIMB 1942]
MKLSIKRNTLKHLSNDKKMDLEMTKRIAGGQPDMCPTFGNAACIAAENNSGCFSAREQDCPAEF